MTKPWKIEYEDTPYHHILNGKHHEGIGTYKITFQGLIYGYLSKEAWDAKITKEILYFIEHMLNDANELALREPPK